MLGWLHLSVGLAAEPAAVLLTPIAVVEAGHAWLERACNRKVELTAEDLATPAWAQQPTTVVSASSIRAATTSAPVCFPGECTQDQVGIPVGGQELGALFLSDAIQEAGLRSLSLLRVDGPDPYGLDVVKGERALPPPCASSASIPAAGGAMQTCHVYGEVGDGPLLEVRSTGTMTENDHPRYTKVEARRVTRAQDAWHEGAWSVLEEGPYVSSATPIALAATATPQQVVWYRLGGLCCPSGGKAWTSTWADTGTWTRGTVVTGGQGQPCD